MKQPKGWAVMRRGVVCSWDDGFGTTLAICKSKAEALRGVRMVSEGKNDDWAGIEVAEVRIVPVKKAKKRT